MILVLSSKSNLSPDKIKKVADCGQYKLKRVCIYIHTHTFMQAHMCACVCIYVRVDMYMCRYNVSM